MSSHSVYDGDVGGVNRLDSAGFVSCICRVGRAQLLAVKAKTDMLRCSIETKSSNASERYASLLSFTPQTNVFTHAVLFSLSQHVLLSRKVRGQSTATPRGFYSLSYMLYCRHDLLCFIGIHPVLLPFGPRLERCVTPHSRCGLFVPLSYDVVEGDAASLLGVNDRRALDVGDAGYFRRYSTNPTQDADIDLAATIIAGN